MAKRERIIEVTGPSGPEIVELVDEEKGIYASADGLLQFQVEPDGTVREIS